MTQNQAGTNTRRPAICIACGSVHWQKYAVIHTHTIWKCKSCGLGVTQYSRKILPNEIYGENGMYHQKGYKVIVPEQIKKTVRIINLFKRTNTKGSILEIGGGFGLFSRELARNNEYEVEMIEPYLSPFLITHNTKVVVHTQTLDRYMKDSKKKYNGVFLLDVLEHFDHPELEIDRIKNLLHKNGVVVIQLPNYESYMSKVLGSNWSWWMIEDHRYHFTPHSLQLFLSKHGITIIEMQTYELKEDFRKQLNGIFTRFSNPFLRKSIKAIGIVLFNLLYLSHSLSWRMGKGGLILTAARLQK